MKDICIVASISKFWLYLLNTGALIELSVVYFSIWYQKIFVRDLFFDFLFNIPWCVLYAISRSKLSKFLLKQGKCWTNSVNWHLCVMISDAYLAISAPACLASLAALLLGRYLSLPPTNLSLGLLWAYLCMAKSLNLSLVLIYRWAVDPPVPSW